MHDDLSAFIATNPDSQELKRATAVAMVLKGYKHREIQAALSVSSGFISKWTQRYKLLGVAGLKLGHLGSIGYLKREQRQAVLSWLRAKNEWNVVELQAHVQSEYGVVFYSRQSYYTLLWKAGIRWKEVRKRNPKPDSALVENTRSSIG